MSPHLPAKLRTFALVSSFMLGFLHFVLAHQLHADSEGSSPGESLLASLRKLRGVVTGDDGKPETSDCAICLDPLAADPEKKEDITKLGCGHEFHKKCLDELVKSTDSPTCPLCRADIPLSAREREERRSRSSAERAEEQRRGGLQQEGRRV